MNADPYQWLFMVNQSFQCVYEHLDKLKAAGALPEIFVRIRQLKVEEMCSEINLTATIRLHTAEANNAYEYQRDRLEQEAIQNDGVLQEPATALKEAS